VKIVPEMTYNVSSGTLSLYTTTVIIITIIIISTCETFLNLDMISSIYQMLRIWLQNYVLTGCASIHSLPLSVYFTAYRIQHRLFFPKQRLLVCSECLVDLMRYKFYS